MKNLQKMLDIRIITDVILVLSTYGGYEMNVNESLAIIRNTREWRNMAIWVANWLYNQGRITLDELHNACNELERLSDNTYYGIDDLVYG